MAMSCKLLWWSSSKRRALANWAVASWLSKQMWLYYTSFGDLVLSILLMVWVLRYARLDPVVGNP